jgi:hypothetical protein
VVTIQCEAVWTIVSTAHGHFVTAHEQICVSAHLQSTRFIGCGELSYIANGATIGIAPTSLATTLAKWCSDSVAVFVVAKNFVSMRLRQPVVWTIVIGAISLLQAARVQVQMRALQIRAEHEVLVGVGEIFDRALIS